MSRILGTHKDSLFGHAGVQLVARAYTAACQLLAFVLVGYLGSDRLLSAFALSMAAAGLVATAVDFGSGLWIVRVVAAGGELPRLSLARIASLAVCVPVLLGAGFAGVVPWSATPWIMLMGAAVGCSSLWRGVLWARLRYGSEAVAAMLQATLLVGGLAVALLVRANGLAVPIMVAAGAFATGYLARVLLARGLVRRQPSLLGLREWMRQVYSYAGQAVVVSAQTQLDVLLLGALWAGPAAGVAAYGLALRFYYAIGMPFESLGAAVLPRVVLRREIAWGPVAGIAVPVGAAGVAAMLVLTSLGELFGLSALASDYLGTLGVILSLALPFRFASYVLGAIVTGSGNQTARFRAGVVGLVTMVALDLVLIPTRGPVGAAVALVCADIVLMTGYSLATRRIRGYAT